VRSGCRTHPSRRSSRKSHRSPCAKKDSATSHQHSSSRNDHLGTPSCPTLLSCRDNHTSHCSARKEESS
jgi:hypothetical protein